MVHELRFVYHCNFVSYLQYWDLHYIWGSYLQYCFVNACYNHWSWNNTKWAVDSGEPTTLITNFVRSSHNVVIQLTSYRGSTISCMNFTHYNNVHILHELRSPQQCTTLGRNFFPNNNWQFIFCYHFQVNWYIGVMTISSLLTRSLARIHHLFFSRPLCISTG